MAAPAFAWDDFWITYKASSIDDKKSLLDQIDLDQVFISLSDKEASKVLYNAPVEIQQKYKRTSTKAASRPTVTADDIDKKLGIGKYLKNKNTANVPPRIIEVAVIASAFFLGNKLAKTFLYPLLPTRQPAKNASRHVRSSRR